MTAVAIWRNPRRAQGIEYEIREYPRKTPGAAEVEKLMSLLGG